MQNSLIFIVKTLSDLYLLTYLLRFMLQWVHADFYNPLAQFVLRVTNPLVLPARRLLPAVGGVDMPTLIVLIALECAVTGVLLALVGATVPIGTFLYFALLRLIMLTLWFYAIAILIYVILSWVGQRQGNPAATLLGDVVEPVLRPVRRALPSIAGLDLSPLLVLVALQALIIALPLPAVLR